MISGIRQRALTVALTLGLAPSALAQVPQVSQAQISPQAQTAFAAITAHPMVKKALAILEADDANTLNDQKTMTVFFAWALFSSVSSTRPICAYPMQAKYKGTGSTDEAANFSCALP